MQGLFEEIILCILIQIKTSATLLLSFNVQQRVLSS